MPRHLRVRPLRRSSHPGTQRAGTLPAPPVWHARRLGLLGLLAYLWTASLAVAQGPPAQAQLLLHLLDYVAVDYPQCVQNGTVLDQAEYDEQVEFAHQVRRAGRSWG